MRELERVTVGETRPDLTFILDVPAATGLARASARRASGPVDRFEAENESFHAALRQCFLDIAAAEPERCVVIDATQEPDAVETAIWSKVSERLASAGLLAKAKAAKAGKLTEVQH